ncbi:MULTISPECIES: hypothetical protein [Caballeronia]|uniref:Uncharacterized protein n=1 Tax=Caballeronia zhejiangensis TaxID=871203 RepID=A0A656QH15_9BURK|nr:MULTISPECIES: hypothetical protein [Caballeronia]KDR28522.1 hypothetical protein BG60_11130 [Caballeronia zhejiangensis]MCE4547850.1 hypothetical protein [Caballeronia sp. PC1]MCE4575596.1 hypothetical protein [Caballeronia sp. CLC5]
MNAQALHITVHEHGNAVFRYRMKTTGSSSERYGACEVCNQHASEVFHLTSAMLYDRKSAGGGFGWTPYHCLSLFGHRECLEARRIGQPVMTLDADTNDANFRAVINGRDVLIGRDCEGFKVYIADSYEALRPSLLDAYRFAQHAAHHPERRRPVTAFD